MIIYYVITFGFMIIGQLVSATLQRKFKQYAAQPSSSGLTGKQVAEKMLNDNGIYDVKVVSVEGALTDHYNPASKTVNLSDWVYAERSVAAAAVAAHECGHAVQHAQAYTWLQFRSKMVPTVQISSKLVMFVLMAGLAIMAFSGNSMVLLLGIILFAITTAFTIVTLPVEFDASNRALAWMTSAGVVTSRENDQAKDALKWAAMTYVVAALASVAQLMYFIMLFMGRRD
jgi:Zn-dependent membrane protease YugP